jgi:thiamine biosynthesis lipoprotein
VGQLADLWKQAAKAGKAPSADQISSARSALRAPAWRLSHASKTVRPLQPLHLRVAGLAKGYIADKALAAARAKAKGATGILINLGGDIAAWGAGPDDKTGWLVDVADPFRPADNDRPLTTIRVAGRAVASSGGYARNFTIAGRRYSYVLNPLTGRPAEVVEGATVVAPDAATADAAATSLCVLSPVRGVGLVNALRDVECVVVDASGMQHASKGWRKLVVERAGGKQPVATKGAWPKGYGVIVQVALRRHRNRPMLAAWVVDEAGRPVKMLALWGESKYYKSLRTYYRLNRSFRATARNVTRASPRAGVYALAWDGTNGSGRPVKPGTYTVNIEIVREKGSRVTMTGSVHCGTTKVASARIRANLESDGAQVRYGPTGT